MSENSQQNFINLKFGLSSRMVVSALQDQTVYKFLYASNIIAFITWILTLIHDNYSQVDRIWPILPILYSWGFVFTAFYYNPGSEPAVQIISENRKEDAKSPVQSSKVLESDASSISRLVIMAILITMWGTRLVYNYWRKDGYKRGSEDYRWEHVKKMFNYPQKKITFHIFNFAFIAFFQNWLLFSISLPFWFIQTNKSTKFQFKQEPLNWFDLLLICVWIFFFSFEVIGDKKQFEFQTNKYKWLGMSLKNKKIFKETVSTEDMEDFKRGYCTTGLFSYTRHPNFFGEIGMWWTIATFSLSSQLNYITKNFVFTKILPFNYAFIGALCYTILFHKSTELTEKITASKYPSYKEYQQKVNRIFVGFSGYKKKSE